MVEKSALSPKTPPLNNQVTLKVDIKPHKELTGCTWSQSEAHRCTSLLNLYLCSWFSSPLSLRHIETLFRTEFSHSKTKAIIFSTGSKPTSRPEHQPCVWFGLQGFCHHHGKLRIFSKQQLLHVLPSVGEMNILAHFRRRYRNLTPFFIPTHSFLSVLIFFPFSHKLFLPASTVHSSTSIQSLFPLGRTDVKSSYPFSL